MSETCSKGWGARCARATGPKCRCACGGANHGNPKARHTGDEETMDLTPMEQLEYKLWEPPTRDALPQYDGRVLTFARTRVGEHAIIMLENRPLEQRLVRHSPSGLEFGYMGSGPADTALNILALVVSPKEANRLHQRFKFDMLARIPREGGTMKMQDVVDWVRATYDFELADPELVESEKQQRDSLAEIERLDREAEKEKTDGV